MTGARCFSWPAANAHGESHARPQGATNIRTSLDFARLPWYWRLMTKSMRKVTFNHMTRFGWAVGGVVR